MRRVATLGMIVSALGFLAGLSAVAAAAEPRYVPAAHTEATYRLTTVITANGRETTAAQVYRVTITASDGITAADHTVRELRRRADHLSPNSVGR